MSTARKSLGLGGLALLPILCCVGLPVIAAAGVGVAAVLWVGGIAAGALVLAAVVALIVFRLRARRACRVAVVPKRKSPL